MFPEPDVLGKYFHELFKILPDQQKKKAEWKKNKKGKISKGKVLKGKEKRKPKLDGGGDMCMVPEVELAGNASSFAVFATVRLAVLERWMKEACEIYLSSSGSSPAALALTDVDSDVEELSERLQVTLPRIPKIVGVGLRSVFELIRESRNSHPAFCTKALRALLDILQGQQPEGLKNEPAEVIDPLFDLLLDLATLHGPLPDSPDDGSHLTAVACACLLSLVTDRGDTGRLLCAVAALLMSPRALAYQNIMMPSVLASLQRSVHGVLLGKTARPDWISCGVPRSSYLMSFDVKLPASADYRSSGLSSSYANNSSSVYPTSASSSSSSGSTVILATSSNSGDISTCTVASNSSLSRGSCARALASDGRYLYLHNGKGLFKIGSGYGGTLKGHIYMHNHDFYNDKKGWLGYAQDCLYFRLLGSSTGAGRELISIETDDLTVLNITRIDSYCNGILFSDGEFLGVITSAKDDGFVVKTVNPSSTPSYSLNELPLKLARKCVDVCGVAAFDEESAMHTLHSGTDDEVASIVSGKEFSLIRTTFGKVLYCGKSASLGMKQGGKASKWAELIIPKSPKINLIASGHDGLHAVLVAEDGSVFFTGTARRGEDGDQNKVRRQPKAVKPKKITTVDGQIIIHAACNNGTTALVTRDGELLMFGKDTTHCDPSTGVVTDLKDVQVVQVSLGKAHAAVLTNKGHLYTFGINNKGQCGRDFASQVKEATVVAMETTVEEEGGEEEELEWFAQEAMCFPGTHKWKHDLCMVCTICRECTGYSISCLSSMRPDRNPGQECGCGEGDSGCAECGCCRICARESVDNSELAILGPSGAGDIAGMMRLDLIFGGRHGARLQDHLQRRLDERKQRQRGKVLAKHSSGVGVVPVGNNAVVPASNGGGQMVARAKPTRSSVAAAQTPNKATIAGVNMRSAVQQSSNVVVVDMAGGSDVEREASRVTSLPPARVYLPNESPVVQIASGLHHTVALTQSGDVYTFGSNSYGQLGCGDIMVRGGPVHVKLPGSATHVAAGSNHTVVLLAKGEVYTFGSHQKNQLGRSPLESLSSKKESQLQGQGSSGRCPWYSIPGPVPQVGPRHGRRATWVGASAEQTYLKLDESLINSISLNHSSLMANKNCIVLLPTECVESKSFRCLVINKRDGNCSSFSGPSQVDFSRSATCLDPFYNVLWSYNEGEGGPEVSCYNVVCSETRLDSTPGILYPELALPNVPGCFVTRSHAALHLLGALDTLTQAQDLHLTVRPHGEEKPTNQNKVYTWEDFSSVTRFESHGGGWGYSGHSIEAIRFMADTDILLGGFGLFGGRGEYTGKIKLFDIGMDGGEQENDGEMLAETDEIPYECGPRQKYPMLFEEPVPLQANRWYVAWARVSGPSSDCGSGGQGMVTTEDQVVFYFKSSKKSNNGTDVNAGQIPQLLYRIVTTETQTTGKQSDNLEPLYVLSREFSRTVSKECFQSLLALLQWSWNTYRAGLADAGHSLVSGSVNYMATLFNLERLVYICKATLRLICTYTNEIYPNQVILKKQAAESVVLAECIGEVRALLRQILLDSIPVPRSAKHKKQVANSTAYNKMTKDILDECHETFVACFHAFYPTAYLKWTCLCELLASMDKTDKEAGSSNTSSSSTVGSSDRLISAVLAALCSRSVRLRSTFPLLSPGLDNGGNSLKKQLSPSDNSGLPMMPCIDTHYYPILVEQMSFRSQLETSMYQQSMNVWQFREVLDKLLDIVTLSVKQALCLEKVMHSSDLVYNCCHLLVRVVAELASQASGIDEELEGACGRILHSTPSRFTRTNQSRTWNTGNGSPDAICFSVDRPGIVIAGAAVYGGVGSYNYELELLDDQNNTGNDPSHTQRWNSLQLTTGVFGPDDCLADDIVELKFDYPVFIKENVKYAIRLRNHGGRTSNGDGGLSSVKGPDGVVFTFSTCSLSFNGTTQTRGQIPYLLYCSNPQDSDGQTNNKAAVEVQARKITLKTAGAIVNRCVELLVLARERAEEVDVSDLLGSACLVTTLLPLMLAHISPLATSDPKSGVQVLTLIQELLPHVAALNLLTCNMGQSTSTIDSTNCHDPVTATTTTSHHYAWVESEHPYKPASVSNYRVLFPDTVRWLAVEFSPECGTAQAEDSLQLYIPTSSVPSNNTPINVNNTNTNTTAYDESLPYWPVLHKFSNHWPQHAIVLPGNEVIFSLETASDYVKDEKACFYGFRCLVIGYEWQVSPGDGLRQLEMELSFLGGMCAASLMKKDLVLPVSTAEEFEEDMETVEETARQIFAKHSSLLGKGFALANPPTINQALDGILPYSCHSNERLFLRDLVQCVPGTSGGRLSRWLQPDPFVDPSRCQVLFSRDDLRCGWPANITILTKDQYGDLVYVPNLKVEVKAVPIDKKEIGSEESVDNARKLRRVSQPDEMTIGGHALPCLDVPYEVTVKDKMCYHAISIMKAFENYSFEELRYISPAMKRSSENMLVRPNCDGSYSVTWTPGSVGWYSILTTIDGYSMDEGYKVEVKEPPQGLTPPNQSVVRKTSQQPNRLRKFVAKNSAGLRVRAHPSLQSEQIGIVHVNGTIAFIDEIHNDDGVWLRLNQETIRQYCSGAYAEAWCLQYNQHLGKTLLLPLQEPKSILDHVIKETIMRKTPSSDSVKPRPHAYKVVLCGASGHNVRSKPSLKAPPIGMLVLGNTITVTDHLVNSEGTWVQLDKDTMNKYCFTWEGEAWSLASDKTPDIYLQPEPDLPTDGGSSTHLISGDGDTAINVTNKKGFDFSTVPESVISNFPIPVFTSGRDTPQSTSSSNSNPFVFGSPSTAGKDEIKPYVPSGSAVVGGGSRSSPVTRWLKPDDGKEKLDRKYHSSRDLPPELLGVSVKELVKAIGESRANGNGITPPDTPRRASRSSSPHLPSGSHPAVTSDSATSSPVPIPAYAARSRSQGAGTSTGGAYGGNVRGRLADSRSSSPPLGTSPRSIPLSPLVSAESGRRGSTQSDTSALVSSLTRDPTPSASPSPSSSSMYTPSDTPKKTKEKENVESDSSSKLMAQAGTQTSPEEVKGHFSIGMGGSKDESKLSPKLSRKERPVRSKRTMSPASPHTSPQQLNNLRSHPSQQHTPNREPVKEALSPSVAESLRATFAAFLWHEGIVHDAMACASFLKFHPSLPKQGALVITRHIDRQRVTNQRHSVEVSTAGSYLHIKPSTLETLTRSAANANANRHRKKQHQQQQQSQSQNQTQQPQQQGIIREEGFKSGDEDGIASVSGVVSTTGSGVVSGSTVGGGSGGHHTVTVLPPALKCLVLLWEELTNCCLQTFSANAVLPSPTVMMGSSVLSNVGKTGSVGMQGLSNEDGKRTSRKKKEWKPSGINNAATNAATAAANASNIQGAGISANGRGSGTERESLCELCGGVFPHPITYHMKQAHPGCGGHAGGKGYNSGGNYCVGWAGNCGDGGVGGSSWYLVCDNCRDRYLKGKKPLTAKKLGRKKGFVSLQSDTNKIASPASLPVSTEMHRIMKDNAMFLLELSGVSSARNVNQSPPEQSNAFPPPGPFQCLYSLGVHPSQLRDDSHFLPEEMIQCRESRDLFTPMRAVTESPASDSDSEGNRGRLFHRSISMGTNGAPWSRQEGDGRVIMMRKRNNSTCEIPSDAGSSLLCHPSPALQKLVPSAVNCQSAIVSGTGPGAPNYGGQMSTQESSRLSIDILSRPVLLFLLEQHNLRSLQLAMKQALRKATCRVYAMQALNWLLRSVTQATSIHDLLWWLVAALTPATFVQEPQADHEPKEEGAGDSKLEKKDEGDLRGVCEHPLSDMGIVGQAVHPLPFTFHTLLQTVADLMVLLPMGSALQQMAVRCFGIHFTQADHTFLHRCHVFSNISKILSRSEEEQEDAASASLQESSHHSTCLQVSSCVETLRDLTHSIDIKASSRQAMVGSLTDNSTETFWESGDEDRNKTKMLTLTCPPHSSPRMIYIHIDNCRDLANKVSNVTFFSGFNCEELVKLRTVEVESRATGWLNCTLLDIRHNTLRLELKGPDNSLRLRQIRVLGGAQSNQHQQGEPVKYTRQHSAIAIQQHNTEAETLKVFRLITSQVFGKLITGEQEEPSSYLRLEGDENEESNDLKEHVVGILFSRSKLTHLQKQVCAHIVQAIRRETLMLREEWESKLCSAAATSGVGSNSDVVAPDTYCFEMLSMVLALSGSSVGRSYLSQQHGLINDLLSLLHTGSARVQRQVTGLVRRMLPEVSPTVLANLTGVSHLPPTDFSIAQSVKDQEDQFDSHRVGILDVFLSCIAKALTVQVKVKSKDGKGVSSITLATSIHPRDPVGPRWWIRGCMSRRLAEDIIQLVKDMAAGKLSEVWARVTKAAIAENIINLTRLSESQRNPSECLRCPTLWISLASLCVLDNDHVERLSSTQWRSTVDGNPPPPRPTCNNHDDGETNAIIQCNQCGNLCADCDRFLHLHRKTRMHHRQVCKEEEEAIKVDLHEGCGRTKLFWALLLADSCTLKAMVEFREGARSNTKTPGMVSGICRFCGATDNSGLLAIGNICADQECQEHGRNVCIKLHPCGHLCGGIKGEAECLPCLHNCSGDPSLKQDADDMCMICFTEALSCAPALQLKCGHVFHLHCCRNVLQKKWAGPRITFSFSQCPICKAPMDHPVLNGLLSPIRQLYEDVRRKALMRLEYEGLDKGRLDPATYAMDRYAYYVCFKCCKAYYGGEARCDAELGGTEFDPSELVCGACSDVSRAQMCPKHGTDFLEYKCRYCCSVAVFFCFGTTHFCNACHDDFQRVTNIPRGELPSCPAGPKAKSLDGDECPLHVKHPPTGEEFALGCGVCRNAHTF